MQQTLTITTSDNHTILGIIDSAEQPSDKVIIFVHGLTGNSQEHHYYNAPKFFVPRGFDTCRFDLYGRHEGARVLKNSTLSTHASDLNDVVEVISQKYKHILVVGHSLAVFPVLQVHHKALEKLVLRDPSSPLGNIEDKKGYYLPETDAYMLGRGMDIMLGKEMVEEWKSFDIQQAIKDVKVPTKIIFAGEYNKFDIREELLPNFSSQLEYATVPGAGHCFYEEGTLEKLYDETLRFLR